MGGDPQNPPQQTPSVEANASPVEETPNSLPPRAVRPPRDPVFEVPSSPGIEPPPAERTPHRPLLASEALMEDLAPVEPARDAARIWCACMGVAFLLFGALPLLGWVPGRAPVPWFLTGVIALVASITRVTYRQRAVAMVVLGLLSGMVALHGAGHTLLHADGGAAWALTRLIAAVVLPAAALFRARYRAYTGARIFLGAALALSLPFAAHASARLVGADALATGSAVVVLFVLAGSLVGFMGSETTGAGAYVAGATVVTLAMDLALRGLEHGSWLAAGSGAVAFGGASGLAALGLFQILAWRFAADARRIDLHSRRESRPPGSDRDPASEWSTRD